MSEKRISLRNIENTGGYYVRDALISKDEQTEIYTGTLFYKNHDVDIKAQIDLSTGETYIEDTEGTGINRDEISKIIEETIQNIFEETINSITNNLYADGDDYYEDEYEGEDDDYVEEESV